MNKTANETKRFLTKEELINEMYKLGIQNMNGFQTDLIKDAEEISELDEECDYFTLYWVVRKNGTHTRATAFDAASIAYAWNKEFCFACKIRKERGNEGFTLEKLDQ